MDVHAQGTQSHRTGDTVALTGSSAHRFSQTASHLQEWVGISKCPRARVGTEIQGTLPSRVPCTLRGLGEDMGTEQSITLGHLKSTSFSSFI